MALDVCCVLENDPTVRTLCQRVISVVLDDFWCFFGDILLVYDLKSSQNVDFPPQVDFPSESCPNERKLISVIQGGSECVLRTRERSCGGLEAHTNHRNPLRN